MNAKKLTVLEKGPFTLIGIKYEGKNENNEIPQLWDKQLIPRCSEIKMAAHGCAFGVCRCLPEADDGAFEYIGGFETDKSAPVPAGMLKMTLPRCHYAIFEVPGLERIQQAWNEAARTLSEHKELELYCGPDGCGCATHPGFEFYPSEFPDNPKIYIYIPVKIR
jgi:AraC family transcriptional regulator